MNPLVSICIPTYEQNGVGAKHLDELLQRIYEQNIPSEVCEIIVSDNSDDDSIKNVTDKYYATRFNLRYFRYKRKGAAYNANHAINQAAGEIIKVMFMDDYFTEADGLDHFIRALQDPGKHWAISDSIWVDDKNETIMEFPARYDGALPNGRNTIGMPSVIAFKKTDLRFDASFASSFDTEFYYRMFKEYGAPAHIAKPVIAQRIHKNSLSSIQKDQRALDRLKIMRKHNAPGKVSFFHRNRNLGTNADGTLTALPATGIVKNYKLLCKAPSDINQHMPLLKEIAMQCEHITEFGVRNVVSTYAFLEGTPKTLVCYDIKASPQITPALKLAEQMGVKLHYKVIDVLKADIAETDFLFEDTLHTYEQVKKVLELHAAKVRKFIGFHDVTIFGLKDETGGEHTKQGILPAIFEFLQDHPEWSIYRYMWGGDPKFNNGILILKKDES